jgi:outer membrane protein OmpA-like peptidoglycan-associated protein
LSGLTSCAGVRPFPPPSGAYQANPAIGYVNLQSLPQTIGLEYQDRINRFGRLSAIYSVKPPQIDQLQLSAGTIPGTNYPIPVVRIIFDATVFFDFDRDRVRPEAEKILDVIAENMRHDVPDARLLVLESVQKLSIGIAQFSQHQADRGKFDECECVTV